MSDYPSFSDQAVQEAIEAAHRHYAGVRENIPDTVSTDDGHVALSAECISVTLNNGKACINLPLGIGSVCIPIPISYDGKVAQACLSICSTWGIPHGVRVTISVGGVVIVSKTFLKC